MKENVYIFIRRRQSKLRLANCLESSFSQFFFMGEDLEGDERSFFLKYSVGKFNTGRKFSPTSRLSKFACA